MKKLSHIKQFLKYLFLKTTNKTIHNQLKDFTQIPIIIISYNQLENLKKMIDFFLERNFKNIVVIDNCSTYEPLIKYFDEIKDKIKLERLSENKGHTVFFTSPKLIEKYAKGYYVLTDPDIIPNPELPHDFLKSFIHQMDKNFNYVTKVGFALDLKNIPETYPQKSKVIEWESKFWEEKIEKDIYFADIDTTFALYKPQYPNHFRNVNFFRGIRFGGHFTSDHMGWHIDPKNYTDEQKYYFKNSNNSSSWKLDENGELAQNKY